MGSPVPLTAQRSRLSLLGWANSEAARSTSPRTSISFCCFPSTARRTARARLRTRSSSHGSVRASYGCWRRRRPTASCCASTCDCAPSGIAARWSPVLHRSRIICHAMAATGSVTHTSRHGRSQRPSATPSFLAALAQLASARLLPPDVVAELRTAYVYLRRLENRLQMLSDAQVHRLPEDSMSRERIALAMGAADWAALARELQEHRERVSRHFRLVVFGATDTDRAAVRIDLGRFWDTQAETAALAESLAAAGFTASNEAARLL